jgi:hypothetical protein
MSILNGLVGRIVGQEIDIGRAWVAEQVDARDLKSLGA